VSTFSLPVVPRFAEVDQQGVVFNAHYLTWFDEACTGFLDHLGVTYPGLIATGHDIQVVHSEIDYLAGVRWRDSVRVAVQCERIGSTSCSGRSRLQRKRDWVSVSPSAWRLLKRTGVASGFTRMSPVQSSFAFRFHPNRPNARDHEYVDGLRHR